MRLIKLGHAIGLAAIAFCCLGTATGTWAGTDDLKSSDPQSTGEMKNQSSGHVPPSAGTRQPDRKIMLDALELRDMDIRDVLKLVSSKTGLNILAGGAVQGRVTMFMQDVEVHDALRIILEANDLAYTEEGGIVHVMPSADFERIYGFKFGLKTVSKVIALKGMKASDAAALVGQVKSSVGKVIADDQSNTIMLEDTPERMIQMESYLARIDVPTVNRVFEMHFIQAEEAAKTIGELVTPKLGTVRFDAPSNKVFVLDTADKMSEIGRFLKEVDVPRSTEVFDLSYVKAEAMSKLLVPMLTPNAGHLEPDAASNKIIVTDTAAKMAEIAKIVHLLDRKEKEVLIEARIVQVVLDDAFRMGLDWETLVPDYHDLGLKGALNNFGASGQKARLNIGTLSEDRYNVVVEALSTIGKTRVLSNPRIAVVNNEEAKILIGTTKPYVTTTTTTTASGPSATAEAVNFIDVGVKLRVTPVIHDDGYITMKIKPEVSSAASSIITGTNNEIPIVDTSEVETTIRVKDGVTIVIGGLIKEEQNDVRKGVPVLGKIPLVGAVFRSTEKSVSRTEIIIFLTPRVISGDVEALFPDDPTHNPS